MISERDISKLKAIGYDFRPDMNSPGFGCVRIANGIFYGAFQNSEGWTYLKTHAQSPEGLRATMGDKVRWLKMGRPDVAVSFEPDGQKFYAYQGKTFTQPSFDSPETAIDALFWQVP